MTYGVTNTHKATGMHINAQEVAKLYFILCEYDESTCGYLEDDEKVLFQRLADKFSKNEGQEHITGYELSDRQ